MRPSVKAVLTRIGFAIPTLTAFCSASYVSSLSRNAQQLLNESMTWMDIYYNDESGYLYNFGGGSALRGEIRNTVWYALGCLARNEGSDVARAERMISGVIQGQYAVEGDQWYGVYQKSPSEPYVGSPHYIPNIYNSWDPNWRGFVGTTFVMMMEEFGHLLSDSTQELILKSLHNATIGDSYRVGGVDDDNLYPSYSNPAIMRAFLSGWTGRRIGEANFTTAGENYAREIIELFDKHGTLSEFNSGTYTGVSLYGLVLWSKYLPQESIMAQRGPDMLAKTWEAVADLWHPGMKNMAGPWDRSYGYDMNRYLSLMALWLWVLVGKENSSLISKVSIKLSFLFSSVHCNPGSGSY
jgi:hypothetical protein